MSNIVELLLRERNKSYEVLIKNSNVEPIMTGHCPECQEEHHDIDFKEEVISPTPIPHESKPDTHITKPNKEESESESESESFDIPQDTYLEESESESESLNSEEVNSNDEDDDLMFL